MATFYQTEQPETFQVHEYAEKIEHEGFQVFSKFRQILNSYTFFHVSFILVTVIEALIFSISILSYSESIAFITSLASLVLTIFSYLILNYYFQGKKSEQFTQLRTQFIQSCKKHILPSLTEEEIHLAMAKTAFQLAHMLSEKRIYALSLPPFKFFKSFFLKTRFIFHFKDVLLMQELFIQLSLDEYVHTLLSEPTDLAIHTSLANVYMTLSKMYERSPELSSFISDKIFVKLNLPEKIELVTKSAIEELKILDELAPNDPWTHAQLASCYHQLKRWDDELSEYEILANLRSKDKEILLRQGVLYFKLGKTAKGLLTYEALRKIDAKYAGHLLSHYHSFKITQ